MNLRWLWLNHVPHGITLRNDERRALKHMIRTLRNDRSIDGSIHQSFVRAQHWIILSMTLAYFFLLFSTTASNGPEMWMLIRMGLVSLMYIVAVWAAVAWTFYRSNAPYVRRALNRMGYPVCLECGYPLLGLAPTAPCPECGARREIAPPTRIPEDAST